MASLEGRKEGDVGVYSGDPAWDDVVPIIQAEVEGGLASIAYTEEYAEATSYLRAVMATSEHSPRTLALTSHIISLNPAHYTVWLYRAKTLFALNSDLHLEVEWLNDVAIENQKNYQIWHHRQLLITHLYPFPFTTEQEEGAEEKAKKEKEKGELVEKETAFLSIMLSYDSKNYHVWSYRQWLTQHLCLFSLPSELEYTSFLVYQDLRNNSAYSHRFFLVFSNPEYCTVGCGPTETDPRLVNGDGKEVVEREVEWAKGWILEAPQNASSWGYLRGVLRKGGLPLSSMSCFASNFVKGVPGRKAHENEGEAGKEEEEEIKSSHALEFLADVWEEEGTEEGRAMAVWAWGLLAEKYDVVRRNYWEWRKEGGEAGLSS